MPVSSLSHVWLFATPQTVTHQAPLSMGFPRQECWSGLPFPSPGFLPDPGIKPTSPALWADSLPPNHQGSPTKDQMCPDSTWYQEAECLEISKWSSPRTPLAGGTQLWLNIWKRGGMQLTTSCLTLSLVIRMQRVWGRTERGTQRISPLWFGNHWFTK